MKKLVLLLCLSAGTAYALSPIVPALRVAGVDYIDIAGTPDVGDLPIATSSTTAAWGKSKDVWIIAVSDETTDITTGTAKTFRAPRAATVTSVRASVNTVSSSGLPTFNIKESGTTIFSTNLTIDANEKTSVTAATAAVISDNSIADDAEMTVDIVTAGTGAKGAKIAIYVTY